ncbi:MAG: 50S ribosomal protein L11 methyltransferase [Geovibrio sp.]|nr:50S ribosomal protein L11 methyltransferase [Geovibrio sp.]
MYERKIYEIPLKGGKTMRIRQGAFGSGEHETTLACLNHLQRMDLAGKRVLDVGCGTGILGIAACMLGAEMCIGFDPSFAACETALFCNELNGVTNNYVICGYNDAVHGRFDVVAANIYQDILIALCPYIADILTDEGIALLSGIPLEYNYDVRVCYERQRFKVLDLNLHDEYSTILLKKGG